MCAEHQPQRSEWPVAPEASHVFVAARRLRLILRRRAPAPMTGRGCSRGHRRSDWGDLDRLSPPVVPEPAPLAAAGRVTKPQRGAHEESCDLTVRIESDLAG